MAFFWISLLLLSWNILHTIVSFFLSFSCTLTLISQPVWTLFFVLSSPSSSSSSMFVPCFLRPSSCSQRSHSSVKSLWFPAVLQSQLPTVTSKPGNGPADSAHTAALLKSHGHLLLQVCELLDFLLRVPRRWRTCGLLDLDVGNMQTIRGEFLLLFLRFCRENQALTVLLHFQTWSRASEAPLPPPWPLVRTPTCRAPSGWPWRSRSSGRVSATSEQRWSSPSRAGRNVSQWWDDKVALPPAHGSSCSPGGCSLTARSVCPDCFPVPSTSYWWTWFPRTATGTRWQLSASLATKFLLKRCWDSCWF